MAHTTAGCHTYKLITWALTAVLAGVGVAAVTALVPRGRRHRRGTHHRPRTTPGW